MKRLFFLLILFSLFVMSCNEDDTIIMHNASMNTLSVKVSTSVTTSTKSLPIASRDINNLCVLLFDENGFFISRHFGELKSGTTDEYYFKGVPLSGNVKRTLHFIANITWTGFSDADNRGKHETEVITSLYTEHDVIGYWKNYTLANGFGETQNQENFTITEKITLERNIAQISVISKSINLTNIEFAVGRSLDRGTIAPFNASTQQFINVVTEAKDGKIKSIDEQVDFKSAGNVINVYERENVNAADNAYVIIKGNFKAASAPSYYKIDIVDAEAIELLDLLRNTRYSITLNGVATAGYSTLAEAESNVASNNISASVSAQEIVRVSDGIHILEVDATSYTFVKTNEEFSIGFKYINTITNQLLNDQLKITYVDEDSNTPVVAGGEKGLTIDYKNGTISGKTVGQLPQNRITKAYIMLSNGGTLSRKINLRFREPMDFQNVTATPDVLAEGFAQPVTIHFNFLADVAEALFPVPVYIYSKHLSPDPSITNPDKKIHIDATLPGEFRYVYMAPYLGLDENNKPITHTMHFVTNSPSFNEEIKIESEMFNPSVLSINTSKDGFGIISDLQFSNNGDSMLSIAGTETTMSFSIAPSKNIVPPYRINIFTEKLEFLETSTGETCVWNEKLYCYEYTTKTEGIQYLTFKSRVDDCDETIRIDGYRFNSVTTKITSQKMSVKYVRNNSIIQQGIGHPFQLSLGLPTDKFTAEYWDKIGNKLDVYLFGDFVLSDKNTYAFEIINDDIHGNGYKLMVDQSVGTEIPLHMVTTNTGNVEVIVSIASFHLYTANFERVAPPSFSPLPKEKGTSTDITLSISVPAYLDVTANAPLWVWLDSGSLLNYRNNTTGGNIEVYTASGKALSTNESLTTNGYWLKITAPGNKTIRFRNRASRPSGAITAMSVSGQGNTAGNGILPRTDNLNK
ncbi:MAG: fimbrial protein [Marinifilaceae bacterium]